jgi:hypothetical protein
MCDDIKAEDFQVGIYEFQDTRPLTMVKSFRGSAEGWTVTSLPQSTQYDIKQYLKYITPQRVCPLTFVLVQHMLPYLYMLDISR